MERRTFNLTLSQAIDRLAADLAEMVKQPRGELGEMDPDTAFEAGFNVCLQSLRSYTGPDPRDTGAVTEADLDQGDQFATEDTKETR